MSAAGLKSTGDEGSAHGQQQAAKWKNLVEWVNQAGGFVHSSLVLNGNGPSRGIVATDTIAKDELLIRIPPTCVISGVHLPSKVDGSPVSAWLRCLGALLQAKKESKSSMKPTAVLSSTAPYIESLSAPDEYETLFQWSLPNIQEYLRS